MGKIRTHLFIPDIQNKPGVPTDHMRWIGRDWLERQPDAVFQGGDFADMVSLSSYDKGKKAAEGRRYQDDIKSARQAMRDLLTPLWDHQRRAKKHIYKPEMYLTLGNHENRINRAAEESPEMFGHLSVDDLSYEEFGWNVIPFLDVITVDGIQYSHFFPRSANGAIMQTRNGAPNAKVQADREAMSSTGAHKQGLDYHIKQIRERRIHSMIAGSCYLHSEDYLGPQSNEWQGIVYKHEVENGQYDPMFLSLDYLCRKYEGVRLKEFMQEKYGIAA